jgi:outer membrane protein W
MKSTFSILAITLGIFLFTGTPAKAEWYVGGQVGFVKPNDLKDVEGVGSANGITLSGLELQNALGYGGKVGYFSPDYLDWLGLELEVITSNPHIKQQNGTAGFGGSSSPLGTLDGSHLRIITPEVNVMFHVAGYYVEPYVGAGIGAFWDRISDSTGSDNDDSPVVNALDGIFGGLSFHF